MNFINECPECGRYEYDEQGNRQWFFPCPSDDCPSHDTCGSAGKTLNLGMINQPSAVRFTGPACQNTVNSAGSVKRQPQTIPLEETCTICGRVRWGNYRYLTKGRWRHDECAPGSAPWLEWYAALPAHRRTSAGDALFQHYQRGRTRA